MGDRVRWLGPGGGSRARVMLHSVGVASSERNGAVVGQSGAAVQLELVRA